MHTTTTFVLDDGGRADAGFSGSAGDCVTRAIAIAAELDYREVYDELNVRTSLTARGGATRRRAAAVKTGPSARTGIFRKVYEPYLLDLGFVWTPTMTIGAGTTVHLRADELPTGRLVVSLSRHAAAVIDGVVHDTHDPSRDGSRCVYGYYRRPDPLGAIPLRDQCAPCPWRDLGDPAFTPEVVAAARDGAVFTCHTRMGPCPGPDRAGLV